jgi:hypothetical protein
MNGLIVFDTGYGTVIEDDTITTDNFTTTNFNAANLSATDVQTTTLTATGNLNALTIISDTIEATTAVGSKIVNIYDNLGVNDTINIGSDCATQLAGTVLIEPAQSNFYSSSMLVSPTYVKTNTLESITTGASPNLYTTTTGTITLGSTGTVNLLTGIRTAGSLNIASNVSTSNTAPVNIGGTNTSATVGTLSRIKLNLNGDAIWSNTETLTSFRSATGINLDTWTGVGTIKIGNEAGTTSTVTIGRNGNGKQTVLDSTQTLVNGELFFPTSAISIGCNANATFLNFFSNFSTGGMNFMNGLTTGYVNIANSFVLFKDALRFNNVSTTVGLLDNLSSAVTCNIGGAGVVNLCNSFKFSTNNFVSSGTADIINVFNNITTGTINFCNGLTTGLLQMGGGKINFGTQQINGYTEYVTTSVNYTIDGTAINKEFFLTITGGNPRVITMPSRKVGQILRFRSLSGVSQTLTMVGSSGSFKNPFSNSNSTTFTLTTGDSVTYYDDGTNLIAFN